MKKTLKILLTFVLVIGFIAASPKTINASSGIKVLLDGQELKFDVPPQIIEGRTLLPLRVIFEALGLEVGWDNDTRIITGTMEDKEIVLKLDSKDAKVNGVAKTLDVPAKAINGRTLVPVRFIAESLEMNVIWDQESKTVKIDKNDEVIVFKDLNFEKIVRDIVKKPEGNIFKSDVDEIELLSIGNSNHKETTKVSNLEGIQNFINLQNLYIDGNNTIIDLTPIKSLSNLRRLSIRDSEVDSLKSLENLVSLKELTLINNSINNISQLERLINLEKINLSYNGIKNIDILENMKYLEEIKIDNTKVSDLKSLTELPKLKYISTYNIPVSKKDFIKVYRLLIEHGVQILTSYDEYEMVSIKIGEEHVDRIKTPQDLEGVLNNFYNSVTTPMGVMNLEHKVSENIYSSTPYDIRIDTDWKGLSPYDIKYSMKFSEEEKKVTKAKLRDLQVEIYNVAITAFPNKKLVGGFYTGFYEYPYSRVGYKTIKFLTWSNYTPSEYIGSYDDSRITKFHWMKKYDDYDFTDNIDTDYINIVKKENGLEVVLLEVSRIDDGIYVLANYINNSNTKYDIHQAKSNITMNGKNYNFDYDFDNEMKKNSDFKYTQNYLLPGQSISYITYYKVSDITSTVDISLSMESWISNNIFEFVNVTVQ